MKEGNNIVVRSTELVERVEAITARPWHLLWGSPVKLLEEELGEFEQHLTDNENELTAQYSESEIQLVRMNVTKVVIRLGEKRYRQTMSGLMSVSTGLGALFLYVLFI